MPVGPTDPAEAAYTYVFVRTDIPVADQLVQVGHACLEAGSRFNQPGVFSNLVLFGVSSQARLRDAAAWVEAVGIRCFAFFEPDDAMGYTAVCTEPVVGDARLFFRRFKLWAGPVSGDTVNSVGSPPRAPPGRAHIFAG